MGHIPLSWLGRQKWSWTSIIAQGRPTQRPRECSPFVSLKMSFPGLRDKKSGSLKHGLENSHPDLGQAPGKASALQTPEVSSHPADIPGVAVMWGGRAEPGSPLARLGILTLPPKPPTASQGYLHEALTQRNLHVQEDAVSPPPSQH